jgi:hypothetical protein
MDHPGGSHDRPDARLAGPREPAYSGAAGFRAVAAVSHLCDRGSGGARPDCAGNGAELGIAQGALVRKPDNVLHRRHGAVAVCGKPQRARAVTPPPGLDARVGRHLHHHRRAGRHDHATPAVRLADSVAGTEQCSEQPLHTGIHAPRAGTAAERDRLGEGSPKGTVRLHEHMGRLPDHPRAVADRRLVAGRHAATAGCRCCTR